VREDLGQLVARDPHELMRALETQSILDCADLAAAASLYRTESRWGLYHWRTDYPERNDDEWKCHVLLGKQDDGTMGCEKRAVQPYIVPISDDEKDAYYKQRITAEA
jgi:succinate dehydrogenase/fumarate reductase flavoprotein subunit